MPLACVLCGAGGSRHVLDKGSIAVVRCDACDFLYLASWQQELERFDEHYAYFESRRGVSLDARISPASARRLTELLSELRSQVPGSRLLDVGCGEGLVVHTANRAGWSARGIDLSASAVDLARERGLAVERLDFFAPALDDERFDAIVMSELIEHVPQPGRFLARAEALLAPGGLLYLTTPNFDSLSRRALGAGWRVIHPQHIGYFTPATLRRAVDVHTTFEVVVLESRNLSLGSAALAVRRALSRGCNDGRAPRPGSDGSAHRSPAEREELNRAYTLDQRMRALAQTRAGALLKAAVNRTVARAGVGESLVALLRRPWP